MGKKRNWEKVGEVVGKIKELNLNYKQGAEYFGIKVEDIYEFNRLSKKGKDKVEEEVKSPDSNKTVSGRSKLPDEIQKLILDYRKNNPDHGFKRIEDHLKRKHLVIVTRKQIRKVLKDHGILEKLDSSFDKKSDEPKGTRRFEADYAGQMYQMDVTNVYIAGISVLYLVVILDDYSRFCVAAELCHDQRGQTLIGVLHDACSLYGRPRKLLTDQGSGFYTWSAKQTLFQQYLDDQQIEHIVAEPHSPQSQGKAERFIQTIKNELISKVRFKGYADARQAIIQYVRSYNFDRPHQGIDGYRPTDRFYGVLAEQSRIESQLLGRQVDLSKGYLVFKAFEHSISVVCCSEGIQVFLDGKLLRETMSWKCA